MINHTSFLICSDSFYMCVLRGGKVPENMHVNTLFQKFLKTDLGHLKSCGNDYLTTSSINVLKLPNLYGISIIRQLKLQKLHSKPKKFYCIFQAICRTITWDFFFLLIKVEKLSFVATCQFLTVQCFARLEVTIHSFKVKYCS